MEYNNYIIEPNNTGYVNFNFCKKDDEIIIGNGKTIKDCKEQINELFYCKLDYTTDLKKCTIQCGFCSKQ